MTAAHFRGLRKVGTPQDRVLAKSVEATRRKVPQKTNRQPCREVQLVRVKRCGKSAPASRATGMAR